MEQQPMMLVPMPMMYYWQPPPPSLPQEAPPEVTTGSLKVPQEECEARLVNHAEEELYYQLAEAYEHPSVWRCIEEKLWVRCTPLQMMESCYVEKAGDYALWGGASEDFERVLSCFPYGFVQFDLSNMEARVISQDQAWAALHALKFALRHLRAYPSLIGFVGFEDGRRCFLEAAWNDGKKSPVKDRLEQELILAVVRTRRQTPVSFW